MASPSTADLSGLFKETYADDLKDLIPKSLTLVSRTPFETRGRIGGKFHQPVIVAAEQGVTYGATGAGAFALENPESLITKDAQVDAVNMVLASSVDYESAAKAAVSKSSFAELTGLKVKSMTLTARKRLEISSWYGQTGLGKVASTVAAAANVAVTISADTFAPLIWAGSAGAAIDYVDGVNRINTVGALKVVKVDIANRVVTLSGAAGDVAAVIAVVEGGDEYLHFRTSPTYNVNAVNGWNDSLGIHGQLTTSGLVYGIDNTLYDLWAPGSFACGGAALTFKKVTDAVNVAVSRGLEDDAEVFISYGGFNNLAADMAALRHIDQSYDPKKAIQGHESLEFHGLAGKIVITPSGYVWGGFGYVLPVKDCKRVGASDLTFSTPGSKGDDIFFQLPGNAGFGMRCYSHQGLADLAPAKSVILTGIVNS